MCARLWTSSLIRTNKTAAHIPHPLVVRQQGAMDSDERGPRASGGAEPLADPEPPPSMSMGPSRVTSTEPWRHSAPWRQMAPRVHRQLDEIFAVRKDPPTK